MINTIFIIFVAFFIVRGLVLGFVGVLARLSGLLLAYLVSYLFAADLAQWILQRYPALMSAPVLYILTGLGLFFVTLLLVSYIVFSIAGLLAKKLPVLAPLNDRHSRLSRASGALLNGTIGTVLGLLLLWVYSIIAATFLPSQQLLQTTPLMNTATLFGEQVYRLFGPRGANTVVDDNSSLPVYFRQGLHYVQQAEDLHALFSPAAKPQGAARSNGSAVIEDASDPDKRMTLPPENPVPEP